MRNKLSNRISFQGSKAQCKKVLSQKVIFAWILKCTTDEFSVFSIEEVMKCIGDEPEAGKEIVQKLMEMGMKPEWIA